MSELDKAWRTHRERQDADPNHDTSPCVCCCRDCKDLLVASHTWLHQQ